MIPRLTSPILVLAGADGVGKDRQKRLLADRIRAEGREVLETSEPWTSQYGGMIADHLRASERPHPAELALLFALDRHRHLQWLHRTAHLRDPGTVILTGRYEESSLVYQGLQLEQWGVADGTEWVRSLNRLFPAPLLTVVIEMPPGLAAERMKRRGDLDRYEADGALQRAVGARYRTLGTPEGIALRGAVARVSGEGSPESVHAQIWEAVSGALSALATSTPDEGAR